jgi:hypothetical protein
MISKTTARITLPWLKSRLIRGALESAACTRKDQSLFRDGMNFFGKLLS